jgi:hypothetical protein
MTTSKLAAEEMATELTHFTCIHFEICAL